MPLFEPATKLPQVGTTIFTVMSRLAAQTGAINLSQGYPDFDAPEELIERLAFHMRAGRNQYPPMSGVQELREQIAVKSLAWYGAKVDADQEVTITSGATEALFCAIHAVVSADDEVILFDPAYDSYDPAVTLAGGRAVHLPLTEDYRIDWQQVRDSVTPRTRLIIINTPHNPTGSVLREDDVQELSRLLQSTDAYLLADEVYEHMVFDGLQHESMLKYPQLAERSFVVSSFGKSCHVTGWKVGYCIAPAKLTAEFRKVHQYVTFTTHTPTQHALADFMRDHPDHLRKLPDFYQRKRDHFVEGLRDSGFELLPSSGTYFQLADYSRLASSPDTVYAEYLTREVGVAAIPVSVFCQQPNGRRLLRFCFAKDNQTLSEAASRLCALSIREAVS